MMKVKDRIVQQLRTIEMQRRASETFMRGSDKVRHIEIKYKEINAPNKVISKADISGEVRTEKFDKIRKEIVSRGLEQKIRKNGIAIAGRPDKNRSKRESTFYNDITEAANLGCVLTNS